MRNAHETETKGGSRITAVTVVVLRVGSVIVAVLVIFQHMFIMLAVLTWPRHHRGC